MCFAAIPRVSASGVHTGFGGLPPIHTGFRGVVAIVHSLVRGGMQHEAVLPAPFEQDPKVGRRRRVPAVIGPAVGRLGPGQIPALG